MKIPSLNKSPSLRPKAIGKQAFIDGPKLFGIEIMDGEAKSGRNWYEIH